MNFHQQLAAWQAELAGAPAGKPGAAAAGQAVQCEEAIRLFEALAQRFDREMGSIVPQHATAAKPGALPC